MEDTNNSTEISETSSGGEKQGNKRGEGVETEDISDPEDLSETGLSKSDLDAPYCSYSEVTNRERNYSTKRAICVSFVGKNFLRFI